jgi:hypothetical protein
MIKSKYIVKFFMFLSLLGILGFIYDKRFAYFFLSYTVAIIIKIIASAFEKKESVSSKYYSTLYLSLLNPGSLIQMFKQLAGQLYIPLKYKQYMNNPQPLKVDYILPFFGTWTVLAGGNTEEKSHSWDLYNQRYAIDLVITDEENCTYKGDGKALEDYYCYSEAIISPADGIVAEVRNNVNDYRRLGDLSIDWKTKDIRGNYVIIKHAEHEFSFLAHLKKGTITVKAGDSIKQGQAIGLCGNSGHSTMPHLHFHIQNGKSTWFSMGIPLQFRAIRIDSKTAAERSVIGTNHRVSNAAVF